jgi:hypothetical protein
LQMVAFVVEVTAGLTVKLSVAIESQPAALVNVIDCEPAAFNVNPFQEYGNCPLQIVTFDVDDDDGFTVKLSVAIESHPAALMSVVDCDPAIENVSPFHEYGRSVSQMVMLVFEVIVGFTVKLSVAIESHPAMLESVTN